jgi:hypothetical protein
VSGGQYTTLGVKSRSGARRQQAFLEQCVRAGERGVTAEGDFDDRREPAERPVAILPAEEGGLGQIHLRREILHPCRVSDGIPEQAHRGRIARERRVGECVDLKESHLSGTIVA